jgi:ATP-binding cassette subfamily G (WHITE) protein 1/ATP-binding cassette subfamily G (WHITE) protein 2
VVVLVSQVAVAMGLWVSTVAPTVAVALAIAPVVLLPFILFSGFLLNVATIAPAFAPLEYTSLFRYGFSASMRILWQGRQVQMTAPPRRGGGLGLMNLFLRGWIGILVFPRLPAA